MQYRRDTRDYTWIADRLWLQRGEGQVGEGIIQPVFPFIKYDVNGGV